MFTVLSLGMYQEIEDIGFKEGPKKQRQSLGLSFLFVAQKSTGKNQYRVGRVSFVLGINVKSE